MAFAALVSERSFEEACSETEVGRGLLAPEPLPLPPLAPQTRPQNANQSNPNLQQRPARELFCLKLDNIPVVMLATVVATTATLSSNSCKSASFLNAFYFRSTETIRREFLGIEANGYKRRKRAAADNITLQLLACEAVAARIQSSFLLKPTSFDTE